MHDASTCSVLIAHGRYFLYVSVYVDLLRPGSLLRERERGREREREREGESLKIGNRELQKFPSGS